jgi:Ca2+-binding RTX toxin-like protein
LRGGDRSDVLYGLGGNDTLLGGDGRDSLFAGDGDDVLNGGPGQDGLCGGSGNNTFINADNDEFIPDDDPADLTISDMMDNPDPVAN